MNGSEEHLDRVLAAFHDAQPSGRLEGRILQSLAEQSVESQPLAGPWLRQRRLTFPAWTFQPPIGLTRLAALGVFTVLLAIAIQHATRRPGNSQSAAKPFSKAVIASSATPATSRQEVSVHLPPKSSVRRPHRADVPAAQESLAMQEMLAPSLAAPPLPLTAQERALSRIGQRHRPGAMTVLNAELREQQQAEATTAFYNFFEPPRTPKSNN